MWERACSRKRLSRRPVFCGCTGLFASKLAPTGPMCCGDGTPPYLMTTCAPTLKRLALYTGLVGAISTRRGDEI
ncbi:hypothetical protein DND47_12505 [Pseudomonas syringae pv. syringae]|nr:hypothetical protein DND47_12505 [Pseudomonas syringae pv. syringae]